MIKQKLLNATLPLMEGLTVSDVRIGLGYTAVLNSSGGLGLACTLRNKLKGGCSVYGPAGTLIGIPLSQLAGGLVESNNSVATALGLAAVNSLTPLGNLSGEEGDILESVRIGVNDKVVMIGHFAPVEKGIRAITSNLVIFEDRNEPEGNSFDEAYEKALSVCDLAVITATSILNDTCDLILKAVPAGSRKVLLGPSTPLFPEVFAGSVDYLSGMIPQDNTAVLNVASQGGGTGHFKKFCRKVNINTEL